MRQEKRKKSEEEFGDGEKEENEEMNRIEGGYITYTDSIQCVYIMHLKVVRSSAVSFGSLCQL